MSKISVKNKTIFTILILLTIFRIGLFVRMPYYAIGGSMYDGHYLLKMAKYITNGWWLGDYTYTTLIKGASFPLFVALANWLCMPYSMLLGLFFTLAGTVFAFCIYKLFNTNAASHLAYLFVLYNPVGFDFLTGQSLYRNVIVFPSVIMIISSLILALHYCRHSKLHFFIIWSLICGIFLGFFYYIREDSIWIWPLIIGIVIIIIIDIYRSRDMLCKNKIQRFIIALIPIFVFVLITLGYKSLNLYKYDVFTVNDRSKGSFAELTGNIIKINDSTCDDPDVWISRSKLEKVIDELPSLKENKSVFLERYDAWLDNNSTNLSGDIPVWVIREAFNNLGYYSNAKSIEAKCSELNQELLDAVDEGRLAFDTDIHFTSQSKGIKISELPELISKTFKNLYDVCIYRDSYSSLSPSTGYDGYIREMESITGVNTVHQPSDETFITGWIISKKPITDSVKIIVSSGSTSTFADISDWSGNLEFYPSYSAEQRKSFSVTFDGSSDPENTIIDIIIDGNSISTSSAESFENDDVILYVDYFGYNNNDDSFAQSSERVISLSNCIISIYKIISIVLMVLSAVSAVILLISFIKEPEWNKLEKLLLIIIILGSMTILEFGITLFAGWLDKSSIWYYSSAGISGCSVPLIFISICSFICIIRNKMNHINICILSEKPEQK